MGSLCGYQLIETDLSGSLMIVYGMYVWSLIIVYGMFVWSLAI